MEDLIQDADFVRETTQEQQIDPLTQETIGGGTVATVNGLNGNITFNGGTTGLNFAAGAPNVSLTGTLVVVNGGTGAITAAGARANLEVPRIHTAAVAPAVTDDGAAGYPVNSIWTDTVLKDAYISVDASTGAAVWKKVSP